MQYGVSMNDVGSSRAEESYGTKEKYDMWVFPPLWLKGKNETLVFLIDIAWSCLENLQLYVLCLTVVLLDLRKRMML